MKKLLQYAFVTIITMYTLNAQVGCSKYYPMVEGSSFEYTNYDKKGKIDGVTNYNISSVKAIGEAIQATLDLKMSDKKGKEIFNSNYSFICENNVVKIDYKSLYPAEMMKQYADMDVEMNITGTDIELPNNLEVGEQLNDANVTIGMDMSGMKMEITIDQTNRKVLRKESVTTSAGTFECIVITETTTSKVMGANIHVNSKLWLAEGIGMVKQESYKKNGNLMSKTELSKYSK